MLERVYQSIMRLGRRFIRFSVPKVYYAAEEFAGFIKGCGVKKALIVTGNSVHNKHKLTESLIKSLKEHEVEAVVFSEAKVNPTVEQAEYVARLVIDFSCDGLIGFGGGSAMDLAKAAACRVSRPDKSFSSLKGMLKVKKMTVPLFAVPTTAGTGSETTICAVITDAENKDKYAINDPVITPLATLLDAELTVSLSPSLTAQTGMDALTHAIEAYIGRSGTKESDEYAIKAVKSIFENLQIAVANGSDRAARKNMLTASFEAGIAFSRAYVGYVHALAHAIGGYYGTPHGLCNAVLLPYVLKAYGKSAQKKLNILAKAIGSDDFIDSVSKLSEKIGIPKKLKVREKDLDELALHADKEANPLYPVPKIFRKKQLKEILIQATEVE